MISTQTGKAIEAAKADTEHPSFITIKTQIGFGCPAKQGKASAHGEPLGVENVEALRKNLNWPSEEPFFVPEEVYKNYSEIAEQKAEVEAAWNVMFACLLRGISGDGSALEPVSQGKGGRCAER